mgnify:CR=1 FL=1
MSLKKFKNLSRSIFYNKKSKKAKLKTINKIPYMWYLTDNIKTKNPSKTINMLSNKNGIVIRNYNSIFNKNLTKKLIKKSKRKNLKILISGEKSIFPNIDGYHIPKWKNNMPKSNKIISISVHGLKDIRKCINYNATLVFIAPIFKTTSHNNQSSLGVIKLGLLARNFNIPIIALGGINEKNIRLLRSLPIHGVGGIDIFENFK